MEDKEPILAELKKGLLSASHVTQLQSIDEVKRYCTRNPAYISEFLKLLMILTESDHPWVKRKAKECIKKIDEASKEISEKNIGEKTSVKNITSLDDYMELLSSFIKKRHIQKIDEFFSKIGELKELNKLNSEQKLKMIIEKKTPNYLEKIFNRRERLLIALEFGINYDLEGDDQSEHLELEIYRKLGFKMNRRDYLEL